MKYRYIPFFLGAMATYNFFDLFHEHFYSFNQQTYDYLLIYKISNFSPGPHDLIERLIYINCFLNLLYII